MTKIADIKDKIIIPNRKTRNIIISQNIKEYIKNLIKSNPINKNTIYTVLFIHIKEIPKITTILKGKYDYKTLLYKIIVIGEETDLDLITKDKLQLISDVRTGTISTKEFELLINKSLLHLDSFNRYKNQRNDFSL